MESATGQREESEGGKYGEEARFFPLVGFFGYAAPFSLPLFASP